MVDEGLVAKRAYEIWEAEGRPHGKHHEHWLRAVAELSAAKPAAAKTRVAPARKKTAATVKSRKTK